MIHAAGVLDLLGWQQPCPSAHAPVQVPPSCARSGTQVAHDPTGVTQWQRLFSAGVSLICQNARLATGSQGLAEPLCQRDIIAHFLSPCAQMANQVRQCLL